MKLAGGSDEVEREDIGDVNTSVVVIVLVSMMDGCVVGG